MFAGYAIIKRQTSSHQGLGNAADFEGRLLRCAQINEQGDVVVHREEVGFGGFAAQDVVAAVRFEMIDGFVCPPQLSNVQRQAWLVRAMQKSNNDRASFNAYYVAQSLEQGQAIINNFWED